MPTRLLLVLSLAACGASGSPKPVPTTGPVPGSGAAYPMRAPAADLERGAASFAGSCSFAKPPGELVDYDKRVTARSEATVFASADFSAGRDNQIGVLGRDTKARASGPIAGGAAEAAGFAVLVIDHGGRVCRGYVRGDAVIKSD